MPYRRLPKTDQARITSLKKIIEVSRRGFDESPISFKTLHEAETQLALFQHLVVQYQQTFNNQVAANRKHSQIVKNVRMYISHFIQVLNLCVLRNEIKKENKLLYHLDPDDYTVPDLTSEKALKKWGKYIIDGENERTGKGGMPIYNPTIAKVKVHYDIFKEYNNNKNVYQSSTARNQTNVIAMREEIDALIKEIWDTVEQKYSHLPPYSRLKKCQECGVIYYYRKGEPKLTPESDKVATN